jgi:hypothetical protein
MKCILLIRETLTFFGSLEGDIDTIDNLKEYWQWNNNLKKLCILFSNFFNNLNGKLLEVLNPLTQPIQKSKAYPKLVFGHYNNNAMKLESGHIEVYLN